MTINQVQLSNTFNEFRQTVNNVSNTVNAFTDGTAASPGTYSSQSLFPAAVHANTITSTTSVTSNNITGSLVKATNLTAGRIPFATNQSALVDNANFTINEGTLAIGLPGALNVPGNAAIQGTTTLGYGANNAVYYASNGSLILTSSGDASGTGRVDANHLHADWHVGAGGDLETWATAKGDNADTHKIFAVANTNAPIDMMVVNQNEGVNAYSEFIAIHATGNTSDGWVSMGVNSSNYAEGAFGITKADDAYLLYSAPVGTSESGDLVIGTSGNGTGNKIIFSANGFDDPANNSQMVITPGQNIHIEIDTQSSNTITGALTVNGGIGLVGNLNVGGNVAITGTITLGGGGNTVSTDSLAVDNPIIYLGANNAADVLDLGVVGSYNDGTTKYVGLVRDASDGIIKFFANTTTMPTSTVNFAEAGLVYPTLRFGSLHLEDDTASSSNTTGALIVDGGAGIAGAINAGGAIKTTNTTEATSTSTGALIVSGGVGVAGNTHVGGTLQSANIKGTTGATISSFATDMSANNNTTVPTTAAVVAYVASAGGGGGATFNLDIRDALSTASIQPIDTANGYTPNSGATYGYSGRGKFGTNGNCFFHSAGFYRNSPAAGGLGILPYTVNTSTGQITAGTRSNVWLNSSYSIGLSTTWMQQDHLSGKTMWFGNNGWPGETTNQFGYCYATIGDTGTVSNTGYARDNASHYRNGTVQINGNTDQTGWYGISSGYNQGGDSQARFNRFNYTGSTPSSIGVVAPGSDTSTTYHVSIFGQPTLEQSAVDVGGMVYWRSNSSTYYLRVYNRVLSTYTDYSIPGGAWGYQEYAFQLSGGKIIHYSRTGTYVYTAYNSRTLVSPANPVWMNRNNQGSGTTCVGVNTWIASTSDSVGSASFLSFTINPSTYAITYNQLEFGGVSIFGGSNLSLFTSGPSLQHLVLAANQEDGSSSVFVYANPFLP